MTKRPTYQCARCGHAAPYCNRCGIATPILGGQIDNQDYCHTYADHPSCYELQLRDEGQKWRRAS